MDKKPVLIDLDGVLRINKTPADGVDEFLKFLAESKIPACILSNSTLYGAKEIKGFFDTNKLGHNFPIITAVEATANYVKEKYNTVSVFVDDRVKYLFSGLTDNKNPEAIVVGDLGKTWNYEIINAIFKKVLDGADLIAMQKNKYWKTPEDGYLIDAGAFIAGFEFSTNKKAILIGKPSPLYFKSGIEATGNSKDTEFIMIGDDLISDIAGAKKVNAKTILILTGKTKETDLKNSEIQPDFVARDLRETIAILSSLLE